MKTIRYTNIPHSAKKRSAPVSRHAFKKGLLIITALLFVHVAFAQWNQLGADIDGEAANDRSGYSVSMSADGLTVAIGAYLNDGNGADAGHTRVYRLIAGVWVQQGADIDGEAADDLSGYSVSMSDDGLTVAIGAPYNDGNGADAGHTRVYRLIAGVWVQQGADIDGEAVNDWSGSSVSMSADGLTVAIGARNNDGTGTDAGHTRVYRLIAGVWVQQGADIDGEAADDRSGYSVSMSADGLTVAIGAYLNDGNGANAGHTRVYRLIAGVWVQQGADIDGEAAFDRSGYSVSMSADGLTVAIGALLNDGNGAAAGHTRVYRLIAGVWVQQGADIDGEAAGDLSGYSVSMSADGLTVAIGALYNDGNGLDAGHTRVYSLIAGVWVQQGADIDGEAASDWSGSSVSMSADGLTVAIGAPYNDGTGTDAGHTRVYSICSSSTSSFSVTACDSYTVPSGDETYTTSQTVMDTIPNTAGCDSVMTITVTINTVDVSVTDNSPTLTANATGAAYQWLDCNNSFATIPGETNQSFTATTNGSYAVEVTENGCTDTSACIAITTISIKEDPLFNDVYIYPNPNQGMVNIEFGTLRNVTVKVFNTNGQLIYNRENIDTPVFQFELNEATGVYFVEINSNNKKQKYKLVIK